MKKTPDGFVKICLFSDLKEGSGKQIFVNDTEIAVFRMGNEVFALSNICPHQKTHLIHEGYIEEGKVTCPVHGWMFDLRTGNIAEERHGLTPYEVKIIDNLVYLKIVDKSIEW